MNKEWEEEFKKILDDNIGVAYPNVKGLIKSLKDDGEIVYGDAIAKIKDYLAKHLSRAVAKERTQLLARVREAVVKERKFISDNLSEKYPEDSAYKRGSVKTFDWLLNEIDKKLEIISEEVK